MTEQGVPCMKAKFEFFMNAPLQKCSLETELAIFEEDVHKRSFVFSQVLKIIMFSGGSIGPVGTVRKWKASAAANLWI